MRKPGLGLLLLVWLIGTGGSQAKDDACTWRGYLIDRVCADSAKKEDTPSRAVKSHSNKCPSMELKSYCFYSSDGWFDLDQRGNNLAGRLLKVCKRKHGCYVELTGSLTTQVLHDIEVGADSQVKVTGTKEKRTLKTTRIREIDEPPSKWSI